MEYIANTSPKLFRGYSLKERIRLTLKLETKEDAKAELETFYKYAFCSRLPEFRKLASKIQRHERHILNTVECKQGSSKVESMNNKIKLYIRKAYGFRNIQNLNDILLLGCSQLVIPLPNRGDDGQKAA